MKVYCHITKKFEYKYYKNKVASLFRDCVHYRSCVRLQLDTLSLSSFWKAVNRVL